MYVTPVIVRLFSNLHLTRLLTSALNIVKLKTQINYQSKNLLSIREVNLML